MPTRSLPPTDQLEAIVIPLAFGTARRQFRAPATLGFPLRKTKKPLSQQWERGSGKGDVYDLTLKASTAGPLTLLATGVASGA